MFAVVVLAVVALPVGVAAVQDTFTASLTGDQEVPPVTTSASGTATVNIITDSEVTEINYEVSYSGLSGPVVAAHIHLGGVGQSGGIMLPLQAGPSPMSGTLKEADLKPTGNVSTFAQAIDAIRAGTTYVNLHTAANPGGEIRGQLKPLLNGATEDAPAPASGDWSALALLIGAGLAVGVGLAWRRPLASGR
jgi:hypothetical protein